MDYKQKYLKYKTKYLKLKQFGGESDDDDEDEEEHTYNNEVEIDEDNYKQIFNTKRGNNMYSLHIWSSEPNCIFNIENDNNIDSETYLFKYNENIPNNVNDNQKLSDLTQHNLSILNDLVTYAITNLDPLVNNMYDNINLFKNEIDMYMKDN